MTKSDLIEFIVYHIECTDCPCYIGCRRDQPKTCREYVEKLFQAVDAVTEQAVKDHIARIRRKYVEMVREKDPNRRRTLRLEWDELRRQLRDIKEYIG